MPGHHYGVRKLKYRKQPIGAVMVDHEVLEAIKEEAARLNQKPGTVAATLLRYWYEDVWLATVNAAVKHK